MKQCLSSSRAVALVVATLLGSWTAGPALAADTSTPDSWARVERSVEDAGRSATTGSFGIAVIDLGSGAVTGVNLDRPYPMMSVFKAPLGVTVLDQVEKGSIGLDQVVTLTRADLRNGTSPIREHFVGDKMDFTVRQLLDYGISQSDNSAADALVRLVGGPLVVTRFLQAHGVEGMRVEMDEGTVSHIFNDLGTANAPPAGETEGEQLQRLRRGYAAYLADPRNRSTPRAAAAFLRKLWAGELLPPRETQALLNLLYAQTTPSRLRKGMPAGVRLADKCGTSESFEGLTAAYNDIGIVTGPNGHTAIVAAFLTASQATQAEREAWFAELGRQVGEFVAR
ncbi:class A beta-lactamase [Trinickia fusca]|uniref:beta-lactamase n=1 Tax=Trinickia fusca TaxID=2419777 RepID=A0A494XNP1_9BURK|nr:class A beta-lactamase [Trinickia fusca]RKP52248.1 serine hydrolase [Trinickia fusca]